MNWKKFLEGLAVAAIGGAVTYGAEAITTPNASKTAITSAAGAGALVGIAAWLKQSPIKPKTKKPKPAEPEKPIN
jgi:hypothetical protein